MNSEKLRVLHVSSWDIPCGIATYCGNLVKGLAEVGVENRVFPLYPHEWQTFLPCDVAALMQRFDEQARQCDLVHFQHEHGLYGHGRGSSYSARRYSDFLKVLHRLQRPSVTTFHTLISPASKRMPWPLTRLKDWIRHRKWRFRIAPRFTTRVGGCRAIVHTPFARYAFAKAGFSPDILHVLPHACLPAREQETDRAAAKRQLGIAPDDCLLSLFGFVNKYKGHDLALKALAKLPERYRLAIVGGTHPESRDDFLNGLLRRLDDSLRRRVIITGFAPTEIANRYFAATDICLAPYRPVGDPSASGAITWALSSGRPTIASKIEAFQAIDREANCLFLVTPGAASEMAWAIERLDHDAARQRELVRNSLAYCAKYSWANTARATCNIYHEVLGRPHVALPLAEEGGIPAQRVA